MRRTLIFVFALVAFSVATTAGKEAIEDYYKISLKLQEILPTLNSGGENALENLTLVSRIMKLVRERLIKHKAELPKLSFDPIEKIEAMMEKVDSLIEARKIIVGAAKLTQVSDLDDDEEESEKAKEKTEKAKQKEDKEKKKEDEKERRKEAEKQRKEEEAKRREESEKILCTEGECCDVAKGHVHFEGFGCNVTNVCREPASLCSGKTNTCETVPKPEGTNCGDGKACYNGVCETNKQVLKMQRETEMIKRKEKELLKKKAIHRLLKQKKKVAEKKEKENELKKLLKRFAVFSWMNSKVNTWEADIEAGDYVQTLPNAPKHEDIFKHNYIGETNRLFNDISNVPHEYDLDSVSENTNTTESTSSTTTNLGTPFSSTVATSSLGIGIIVIAVVLIVAYFIFGGKKKAPQPKTIY